MRRVLHGLSLFTPLSIQPIFSTIQPIFSTTEWFHYLSTARTSVSIAVYLIIIFFNLKKAK
jgi:hypothetical protein